MNIKLCVLLLVLAVTQSAKADCYKQLTIPAVKGSGYDEIRITIQRGGQPVGSAKVLVYSNKKLLHTFVTDDRGQFTITDYNVGKYRLSISGWGDATMIVRDAKNVRFAVDSFILDLSKGCYGMVAG